MKIPGALLVRPVSAPAEAPRDAAHPAQSAAAKAGAAPLVQRPVSSVDQAAVVYLRDRYPYGAMQAAVPRHVQQALDAYESVEALRRREDLRPIQGIDELA